MAFVVILARLSDGKWFFTYCDKYRRKSTLIRKLNNLHGYEIKSFAKTDSPFVPFFVFEEKIREQNVSNGQKIQLHLREIRSHV